jgi:alkylation response protein AidB-like acyl-CoA dehydrogenase
MTTLSADERQELAQSVRSACERLASEERVRAVAYGEVDRGGVAGRSGFDTVLWDVLCNQVGIAAIALPEHLGGAGYGASALGVVAHELGRALAPVPFVSSTVLATGLLLDLTEHDPDADKRLTGLIEGRRTAAAALTGDGGLWRRSAVTLSATRAGDGWNLDGTMRHVLGGSVADDLVVVAIDEDGEPAVFLLDPTIDSVVAEAERVLDHTRPMATITLSSAPALRLSGDAPLGDVVDRNVDIALAVLSAEQVGACERVLEIATDYARTREQFGRQIGSFQAIKHKCADMLVDLEWARSASQAALEALDDPDSAAAGEAGWRANMAKAVCSEALRNATKANVQIHGGIGFTWEDSAHLYFRRARTDEVILGTPGQHWDRLSTLEPSTQLPASPEVTKEPNDVGAIRAEIRSFLHNAPRPPGLRNYGPTPTADDVEPGRIWHRYLADHGYACLHWPREFGGAAATVTYQAVFAEECARADVPRQLNITGADLVGPVLIKFGSQQQKDRYLEPIRLGDDVWCQLFSEPGAGSDLAGVRTRAGRTATGWRIDGQKVWSSAAASARFGLLLARTGPAKHRDLSMFVVPMDIPGVTVRPLTQMDGESKFNEVFFDGAELDEGALIGEVGQGWTVAMVTLGRERLTLGSQAVSMFRLHERMVDAARDHDLLDPVLSRSMTRLWARMWLLRYTWQRAIDSGDLTSPAFSVLKLMTSETDQDLGDMATEVLGSDACADPEDDGLVHHMLVGRAQTILGGTSEIQRNILGERVLGLPKEPR